MYNKISLVGRLGKDPKSAMTKTQKAVCNLWLATSEGDKTEWHSVVCWEKTAENCEKFLKKGSLILVEGRMTYREREKEGTKWREAEIVAHTVKFLDPKPKTGSQPVASTPQEWDDIPF